MPKKKARKKNVILLVKENIDGKLTKAVAAKSIPSFKRISRYVE